MSSANQDIKALAKENRIHLWQVADALGISDFHFSRLLRKELSDEKKKEIISIIKKLKEEA